MRMSESVAGVGSLVNQVSSRFGVSRSLGLSEGQSSCLPDYLCLAYSVL